MKIFILCLGILAFPVWATACGMSALGGAAMGEAIVLFLLMAIPVFLAGYLPYVIYAIKLHQEANSGQLVKNSTKTIAVIFTIINTTVYLLGIFATAYYLPLVAFDTLLWGLPFIFFIKGMTARPNVV